LKVAKPGLGVLLVLILALAGTAAAETQQPPLLGDYITDSRALYPLRVGDWEAVGEKRYEQQELGVSVRYQDTRKPDRWMDLYLYPAGVMFDPAFERVFDQSVDEIVQIARERGAGDVRLGDARTLPSQPVAGEGMLGDLAVKARSFAMEIPMREKRYRSVLAMTVRDLYFIKIRYSVEADTASDEDVQGQAEALLAGFAKEVRVLNTGRCRQILQVSPLPVGGVRPEAVMASTNDGREDEMWIADDTVYLRPAVIAREQDMARLRSEAQSIRDVLRGRCVSPEMMEIAVPDGMREIRFEYRLPPERSDGTTPRLRGRRTGVG
jgi:hypothetical protein